jgi:anion-transporting  ArsA/GET3 family ATPase
VTERRSSPSLSTEGPFIARLLETKRVVVCCGAGGVGKTTTAAALGLAAAMLGKKALVLTIDPARRLAEAIGSPLAARAPTPTPDARLVEVGIRGSLSTWMVDPRIVFEGMVRRLTTDQTQADAILQNRIYRALAQLVAGMQEYTAAEALYGFVEGGDYDIVILDTPPSRNALDFLEAPRKLSLFLDERIVGVFLPTGGGGIFRNRARQIAHGVFARIFGEGFFDEMQQFLATFSGMFVSMRSHAESVRKLLKSDASSFVVVTSPEPAALAEAAHLERTLATEMLLPFSGFILNRSWAYTRGLKSPSDVVLPPNASRTDHAALAKLTELAAEELRLAERDRQLLASLRQRRSGCQAAATPQLDGDIDFAALVLIAESLIAPTTVEDALENR